jgi:hypothetical protein
VSPIDIDVRRRSLVCHRIDRWFTLWRMHRRALVEDQYRALTRRFWKKQITLL